MSVVEGPWRIMPDGERWVVYRADKSSFPMSRSTQEDAQQAADFENSAWRTARLRRAAPEMLAVLQKLQWKSTDKDNMEFRCDTTCYVVDEIRLVIARATGATS